MTYKDIKEAMCALSQAAREVEDIYIENGGEVTEETEAREAEIAAIEDLLDGEGIDSLGRWLKAKEDEKQAIKNEKAKIAQMEKACDKTIEFIKVTIGQVLRRTGKEKVKGTLYSFAQYTSSKTSADKDVLKALYEDKVQEALTAAHIPPYIGVTLTASSTKAAEFGVVEGDEDLFSTETTETCKFIKPRNVKEA